MPGFLELAEQEPPGLRRIKKQNRKAAAFRFSDCQKSLAEFAASAAKRIRIIFCRGVYLAENTSQAASVEFVRLWRTNYARSRLLKLAEKPEGVFRQAELPQRGSQGAASLPPAAAPPKGESIKMGGISPQRGSRASPSAVFCLHKSSNRENNVCKGVFLLVYL